MIYQKEVLLPELIIIMIPLSRVLDLSPGYFGALLDARPMGKKLSFAMTLII